MNTQNFRILLTAAIVLAALSSPTESSLSSETFITERNKMIDQHLRARGITDEQVINAMRAVPRHRLVPEVHRSEAYSDGPLPIGYGQTISQPYIVALMTELLRVKPGDRILEIGTGSGYQAAVLAEIADYVYTVEIVPELGERARADLSELGYKNIKVRVGDGYAGWEDHAPFDAIMVTAAPETIPQPLIDQLKPGGRLVIPLGKTGEIQQLTLVTKSSDGTLETKAVSPVRFVPFTGSGTENNPK